MKRLTVQYKPFQNGRLELTQPVEARWNAGRSDSARIQSHARSLPAFFFCRADKYLQNR
jgi:hypothetical protein